MKLFPSYPFRWQEPWAFARARAANSPGGSKLLFTLMLSVLLCIPLLAADAPDNASGFGLVALIAVGGAILVVFALIPLVSRLPNTVIIMSDRISVGKESVPFSEIAHAVVGATKMGERQFPVLTFRTKSGQVYVYGLSPQVRAEELAAFLAGAGVREPQA